MQPYKPIYDRPTAQLPTIPSTNQPGQRLSDQTIETTLSSNEPSSTLSQGSTSARRTLIARGVMATLIIVLVGAIYLLWQPTAPATDAADTPTNQATPGASSTTSTMTTGTATATNADPTSSASTSIKAYIVGAVQHPGIYTLSSDARVYQLLQAAGGPLPEADLTVVNLAAHVSDGQEVYVTRVGETPPAIANNTTNTTNGTSTDSTSTDSTSSGTTSTTTSSGTLVNINTATATELQKNLHISSTNAQKIVSFRLQHGAYTSTDTLAQVLSATVYKKVKNEVTI